MARSTFSHIARVATVGSTPVNVTFDRDQLPAQGPGEYISYKTFEVDQTFKSITVSNPAIVDLFINIDADPGNADTIDAVSDGMIVVPGGTSIEITDVDVKRVRCVIPQGPSSNVNMVLGVV